MSTCCGYIFDKNILALKSAFLYLMYMVISAVLNLFHPSSVPCAFALRHAAAMLYIIYAIWQPPASALPRQFLRIQIRYCIGNFLRQAIQGIAPHVTAIFCQRTQSGNPFRPFLTPPHST